ncbi:MAG: L,D-transpeptidase, partial [Pseudomonadota bacterium]
MLKRNPDLPRYVPPGPDNPLGEHALYLGWRYYAIHGSNDPTSIGRATTSGCIRLFPQHIAWLYEQAAVGTPVLILERAGASAATRPEDRT